MIGKNITYYCRKSFRDMRIGFVNRKGKVFHEFKDCIGRTIYVVGGKTRPYVLVAKTEEKLIERWTKYNTVETCGSVSIWEEAVASLVEKGIENNGN